MGTKKDKGFWGEGRGTKRRQAGDVAYMCLVRGLVMISWLTHWTHVFTFRDTVTINEKLSLRQWSDNYVFSENSLFKRIDFYLWIWFRFIFKYLNAGEYCQRRCYQLIPSTLALTCVSFYFRNLASFWMPVLNFLWFDFNLLISLMRLLLIWSWCTTRLLHCSKGLSSFDKSSSFDTIWREQS